MSQPPYPPRSPQGRHHYPPPPPQPQRGHGHGQPQPPRYAPPAPPRREPGPPPPPPAPRQHAADPAPAPVAAQQHGAAPRRRRWPWVLGAVVLLFVVIGVANGGGQKSPTAPSSTGTPALAQDAPAVPAESTSGVDVITYEVTGDGVSKANNITYVKDSNFGQQQENGAKLPWSKDVEMDSGVFDLQPMTLVAQSGSGGSGSITCRILRNGEEVTSSTSSGPYAVVTCSGGLG